MPLVHQPKRGKGKEKTVKLSDAQKADIQIGILLGLGIRSNDAIARKVGYSGRGVQNRRTGVNALLIAEIENVVKHEMDANRHLIENVAAEELKTELGKRSGKILANIDTGLEHADERFRAKFAKDIAKDFVVAPQRAGRGKGDENSAPAAGIRVSIGSINVLHGFVKNEPITVPDRQKIIDVGQSEPVSVSLPVQEGRQR